MNLCVKPVLMNWEYHRMSPVLAYYYSLVPGKGDSGSPIWKKTRCSGHPAPLFLIHPHPMASAGNQGLTFQKNWVMTIPSGSGHNRITLLTLGLREAYVNDAEFEPGKSGVPLPTLWRCIRHYTVGAYGEQVIPTVNQRGTVVLRIT